MSTGCFAAAAAAAAAAAEELRQFRWLKAGESLGERKSERQCSGLFLHMY